MGSEWDDNLFRSDTISINCEGLDDNPARSTDMGRITSRNITRPEPPTSIPPPKVRRFSLAGKRRKTIDLRVGDAVPIGRDILVVMRLDGVQVIAPDSVYVGDGGAVVMEEA